MDELDAALARRRAQRQLPDAATRRALRERMGLSQADLAAFCGVERATLTRWELGIRTPRGEAALRYQQALARLAAEAGAMT
jgi:transcriptional regulator with XRE-family HTH domain